MKNTAKVYIIDLYNKYDKDEIVLTFKINGRNWAIKKVSLNWGRPELSSIEENEDPYLYFQIYETLDEAREYVKKIKHLEGTNL